jgi:hypothetical protein
MTCADSTVVVQSFTKFVDHIWVVLQKDFTIPVDANCNVGIFCIRMLSIVYSLCFWLDILRSEWEMMALHTLSMVC